VLSFLLSQARQPLSAFFRPIQLHRIIDQQLLSQFRRRSDPRYEIHQQPIIWHMTLQIRMWEIRSPKHPIWKFFHQSSSKQHNVSISLSLTTQSWRSIDSESFWATDLRPDVGMFAEEAPEKCEFRTVNRLGDVWSSHVVYYDDRGECREEVP